MKYRELIDSMTLEEKASLCSGADFWHTKAIERLGIPSVMLTDGPHGLRKQAGAADHLGIGSSIPATCYPTAAAAANTWDEEIIEEMGRCLGLEAKSEKVSVILGPGVNIKRSPLCGRNFEYYSEDPFLAGKCAAALIRGIQYNGISACVKHFAANSQELRRMTTDSVMDERTLREIYLPAFETAVKEGGVRCLMTSYNSLNGTYTNENEHLLKDILRGEWGYKGMVVTDWGGNNDRVAALKAGDDLEMPGNNGETDKLIVDAVHCGELSEDILDERVNTLLEMIFSTSEELKRGTVYSVERHHAFARKMAAECAVLLKNEDNILPVSKNKSVAVIGSFAKTSRYQGAGSSKIVPTKLDNALDEMRAAGLNIIGYAEGFKREGGKSRKLLEEAVTLAAMADVVLLWLGLDESCEAEASDREHMKLNENQIELLQAVKKINPNIAVILTCGSAVTTEWSRDAKAVLYASLGGQAGAGALAGIIAGHINPSGKLSETFPKSIVQTPCINCYPGLEATSEYREGIYVGYRYYDKVNADVAYPFGHGLSYTSFEYCDIHADADGVSFTVKNTGSRRGAEVAQVYVAAKTGGVFRAVKELKGFKRVELLAGESKQVQIALDRRAFAYWNVKANDWCVEDGRYSILVGSSSRDIRLSAEIEIAGDNSENPYTDKVFLPYYTGKIQNVSDEAFAALLGHDIPQHLWDKNAPLTVNSSLGQSKYAKGKFGKAIYGGVKLVHGAMLLAGKKDIAGDMMFVINMPYRGLSRIAGVVSEKKLPALMKVINGETGGWRELFAKEK